MERNASRRAYLATLGTLGAAALAGCTTGDGEGSDDPRTTDGTTPGAGTEHTTNGTPTPLEPPEGTGPNGVENTAPLIEATRTELVNNDYEIVHTVPTGSSSPGTIRIRSSLETKRNLLVFDTSEETNRMYAANGTRYVRTTADDETSYSTTDFDSFATLHEENDQVSMLGSGEALGGILPFGNYTPAETVRRNGRRLLRFDLESVEPESTISVTDSTGGLLVSPEGVVFKARTAYTTEASGTQTEWSFVIEKLGDVSISEPDWVAMARDKTE